MADTLLCHIVKLVTWVTVAYWYCHYTGLSLERRREEKEREGERRKGEGGEQKGEKEKGEKLQGGGKMEERKEGRRSREWRGRRKRTKWMH